MSDRYPPNPRIVTCLNCGRDFPDDDVCVCHEDDNRMADEPGTELATITQLPVKADGPLSNAAEELSVELLRAVKEAMVQLAPDGILPSDPNEIAFILQVVRDFRTAMSKYDSLIETELVNAMQRHKVKVLASDTGKSFYLKSGNAAKKWDGHGVVTAIGKKAEEQGWGELRTAEAIAHAAGLENESAKFRAGALAQLGLDPSEFTDWVQGRKRIEIV